jgi:hypothetical protein
MAATTIGHEMGDDRTDGRPNGSYECFRNSRMTTSVDSSLRTDTRLIGLVVSLVLLGIAASVHAADEYAGAVTAGLLVLALLAAAVPLASRFRRAS